MNDALELPAIDDLDGDEGLFLRVCLGWGFLDAAFPLLGNSDWDVRMNGIRIQVPATQAHVAYSLGGRGVGVFVFVQKPTGTNDMTAARYIVARAAGIAALGQATMAPRRFAERFESCSADQLATKVTEAARTSA